MEDKLKIGITQGDINGIGYEVIMKTLLDSRLSEMCTPILYGSPKLAAYHRKAIEMESFNFNLIKSADQCLHKRPNIINCCDENIRIELGKSTTSSGEAALASLEMATQDLIENKIDVIVTAPINKHNIQSETFKFPGHTEYFAQKFETPDVLMFMVSSSLKIAVVVGHVAVSKISEQITKTNILNKIKILNQSLIRDFGIRKPKIAVLGLNPHAGDNGLIGCEEESEIIPALKQARDEKIVATGPYPADGFFGSGSYRNFDAVLAMYHDQGLSVFKALNFEGGVNFTAGLPVIRTSPAHGTAYEIAGKGIASPDSFREAIYLAIDIYNNRMLFDDINKNRLLKVSENAEAIVEEIVPKINDAEIISII